MNKTGEAFCTSYLSYSAPTTTLTTTIDSAPSTVFATLTVQTTVTSVVSTTTVQTTAAPQKLRRGDASPSIVTTTVELPYITVSDNETVIAMQTTVLTVSADSAATSGATLTPAAVAAASTASGLAKRSAIPTPTSIVGWPAQKISAACSEIATGTITKTVTATGSGAVTTDIDATQTATQVTSIVATVTSTVTSGAAPVSIYILQPLTPN